MKDDIYLKDAASLALGMKIICEFGLDRICAEQSEEVNAKVSKIINKAKSELENLKNEVISKNRRELRSFIQIELNRMFNGKIVSIENEMLIIKLPIPKSKKEALTPEAPEEGL